MSTTRKTANKAADAAKDATEEATASVNDGVERMTLGMSKMGSMGQENVEAFMASASTFAKGMERIAQENVEFFKSQVESSSDRMQSLSKARTPQEFFEAQSELLRSSMERQIDQTNKVSDMMISTARDAAQPLSKRYSAMIEAMQQR